MKEGPNPERYERLAVPIEEEKARENSRAFLDAVDELRERFHLSDLIIVGCVQVTSPPPPIEESEVEKIARLAAERREDRDGLVVTRTLPVLCRWGSPQMVATLGKIAYQEYTAPHVARAKSLAVKGG
jgi:hypothetical protein